MSILTLASNASAWRGYEYYIGGNVMMCKQINDDEYTARVRGNGRTYDVHINIDHPRKSICNCPHADGRRVICKHMIALYFKAFPNEAKAYIDEAEAYEREQEELQNLINERLIKYINSMSKQELRETLYELLYDGPEWVFERFIRERIEW